MPILHQHHTKLTAQALGSALGLFLAATAPASQAALILPEATAENCVNPTVLDPLQQALKEHQISQMSELDAIEAWIKRCRLIITDPKAAAAAANPQAEVATEPPAPDPRTVEAEPPAGTSPAPAP